MRSNYYSPYKFSEIKRSVSDSSLSFIHQNIRSLKRNIENFQDHLLYELNFNFSVIGLSETQITNADANFLTFNPDIPGYCFEYVPTPLSAGGVGMYIKEGISYKVIEKTSNESFQGVWIELQFPKKTNVICAILYRQHNSPEDFQN